MIGLLGCISENENLNSKEYDYFGNKPFVEDDYHYDNFHIRRKLNNKFLDDKLFQDDEKLFIAIDGVLLNSKQLKDKLALKNNFDLVKQLYNTQGKEFIKSLKGDFSLVLYDKEQKDLVIYTNTTTSKPLYYWVDKEKKEFYFGSNAFHLASTLKQNDKSLTVNEFAFYSVASFGYLYGDHHFANEIKKLGGGDFLIFSLNKGYKIENYFQLKSFPQLELSLSQCVEQLNFLFREAIKLQYDKNEEYGYRQLANLSGGLDSRLTTFVGYDMGYKNIDAITFSSKGHWDGIIAKQIAEKYDFKHSLIYIDDGEHLKNYEDSLKINGGLLSYYFSNQVFRLYDQIDFRDYGLMHTGHLGNATLASTFHNERSHYKYNYPNPHYKDTYRTKLELEIVEQMDKHESNEIMNFYNRGFNFTQVGNQYNYPYSECAAPFTDKEFSQFCLQIPLSFRNNYKLYLKWISDCYPELGKFYYDSTKRRTLNISNKKLRPLHHFAYKAYLKFLGLKDKNNELLNYEKWRLQGGLEKYLDETFNEKIVKIKNYELKSNLTIQYNKNNFQVKLKALHAVLTYELYFIN